MQYRRLGSTSENISIISLGVWQLGDPQYWGSDIEINPESLVNAALDNGINLFDTAEWYGAGESEKVLGKALGKRRKEAFVASKVSPEHCSAAELRAACEASLKRLNTDYLDLYQVHWPFRHIPFEEAHSQMEKLRQEGKIRFVGVSNFGKRDLTEWLKSGTCVSNQVGYNALFRAVEFEIVPVCLKNNISILAYMPLMQGLLAGKWQSAEEVPEKRRRTRHFASSRSGTMHTENGCEELTFQTVRALDQLANELGIKLSTLALAWLAVKEGVTSVVVGARTVQQLHDNISAGDLSLSRDTVEKVDSITNPLKERLGANADMWRSGDDSRIR